MTNRRRQGKVYRPHPVSLNAVEMALNRAKRLDRVDVLRQRSIQMHNLLVLKNARGTVPAQEQAAAAFDAKCLDCWRGLVDAINVGEALAEVGIGRGPQATEIIAAANAAMAAVHERRQESGGWSMTPEEVEALEWLVALHCDTQLPLCSYGEFERAYQRVVRVMSNVIRGNAAPGTKVLTGDIGTLAEGQPA